MNYEKLSNNAYKINNNIFVKTNNNLVFVISDGKAKQIPLQKYNSIQRAIDNILAIAVGCTL